MTIVPERPTTNEQADRRLLIAAAVADAHAVHAPGALLIDARGTVEAVGAPQEIGAIQGARTTHLPGHVLMPALVNAHAHLDLTDIGPRPYGGDFPEWIGMVIRERRARAGGERAAVLEGARLARAGGTAFIGDIAGGRGLAALAALRESGLPGVCYVEVLGIGASEDAGVAFARDLPTLAAHEERGVRLGISPHAPYTCSDRVYEAAAATGLPACTHLSESPAELRFVHDATGHFADLLRRIGLWRDELCGWKCSPVARLATPLAHGRMSMAHGNYLSDADVALLTRIAGETTADGPAPGVAYCPRASAYFGHPLDGAPPHRYRELLAAGVPVALGTDSLICLDTPDRISTLDEMRLLHRRDGTDPRTLLAMATVHGARLLGVGADGVTLSRGSRPQGVIGVATGPHAHDATIAVLRADTAPEWIVPPRAR